MSFLYRSAVNAPVFVRISSVSRHPSSIKTVASFCTAPIPHNSTTDSVKESVQDINKKAGKAAAAGIDKSEAAAQKAKEAMGINASKAEGSASEMAGEAKGKASEMTGAAKGKMSELKGQAEGAMKSS